MLSEEAKVALKEEWLLHGIGNFRFPLLLKSLDDVIAAHPLPAQENEEVACLKAQLKVVTSDRDQLFKAMQDINANCKQ